MIRLVGETSILAAGVEVLVEVDGLTMADLAVLVAEALAVSVAGSVAVVAGGDTKSQAGFRSWTELESVTMYPIDFLRVLAVAFVTLFPVVNPVGGGPIFLALTRRYPQSAQRMLARKIAAYGFVLLSTSFLFGSIVLDFFGITLAVVQICGGLVLAVTGWNLLMQKEQDSLSDQSSGSLEDALDHAFFPLTLPITVGPGCISIAITLGAHLRHEAGPGFEHGYPRHFIAALVGMFLVCVLVMICYTYADRLTRILGRSGTGILIRLSAFILLAIGVQIMSNGTRSEFPGILDPIHNQFSGLSCESQPRNRVVVCPVRAGVSRSDSLRQEANARNS